MTTPINISVFQEYTALILNLLYRSFPNPISLDVKEIGKEMVDSLEISEEEKTRILDKDSINAMRFLAKEEFLEYHSDQINLDQPETLFMDSVLTLKGLTVLGAVPDEINEAIDRRPIIDQLSDALNDRARTALGEVIEKIFLRALTISSSISF